MRRLDYLASILDKHRETSSNRVEEVDPLAMQAGAAVQSGKKKYKKKKKGKTGQPAADSSTIHAAHGKVTEDLAGNEEEMSDGKAQASIHAHLEQQIVSLQALLEEKNSAVNRLMSQIKDQESLAEEIETLRDDLLHQGEEHVEARDALKAAQAEKLALQDSIGKLEKELEEAQMTVAEAAGAEGAYNNLMANYEELKAKVRYLTE